jgi:tetratricopeptide (TPR) repeat protein
VPADNPPAPETPLGLVAAGVRLEREERNASAFAAYDRALALDPDCEPAWMRKAMLLEDIGRDHDAVIVYAELLRRHPRNTAALSNQAGLLLRLGQPEPALEALDRALAADPDNLLFVLNKGLLLLQGLDRPADALPLLERAAQAGLPEAQEPLAWCKEALAQEASSD